MTSYLSRDAILSAPDLEYEDVRVPEWGGVVRVRGMTGAERDQWEAALLDGDKKLTRRQVRATLVALTVVDEQGRRLFSEEDVERLGAKSARALQRVFNVAQRLSRLSLEDVEKLEGN